MNKDIKSLEPKLLWKYFYEITQIPRPSKKEEKMVEYMKKFGEAHGIETIVDKVGNVVFRKPATQGMENRKGIVFQGHLDMVPQKNNDKVFDFEKDAIEAYIDGDWVTADGTTLGADNGIGLAAAMAALTTPGLEHGPLEALFTIDEETGMTGVFNLEPGVLKGDILINLDSEEEGEIYVGCAGGVNANVKVPYENESTPTGMVAYKLEAKGLKGGHSGMDIILGRGNSNKLLFRFMKHASEEHGMRLAHVDGGGLRNAIPRESMAIITIPAADTDKFEACVKKYEEIYKAELSETEPDLVFEATKTDMPADVLTTQSQMALINSVNACPNGVIRMSNSMPGLVETSTNLACVHTNNGQTEVLCLLRSSVDTARDALGEMIRGTFELAGGKTEFDGAYPGWKPNMNSPVLNKMREVYKGLFDKTPDIKAIHAGLECGLIGGVYPNFDLISCGPTIKFPHSPDEKVHIKSVEKFWELLVAVIKNIDETPEA